MILESYAVVEVSRLPGEAEGRSEVDSSRLQGWEDGTHTGPKTYPVPITFTVT